MCGYVKDRVVVARTGTRSEMRGEMVVHIEVSAFLKNVYNVARWHSGCSVTRGF